LSTKIVKILLQFNLFQINSENIVMAKDGITISELVEATGLRKNTIEVRIYRLGIKPLSYEALYPPDTLERILVTRRGRPAKKPKDQEPAPKPPKNPQAPSK
jgi:hypothetical protein